jgi:hypothetical protein
VDGARLALVTRVTGVSRAWLRTLSGPIPDLGRASESWTSIVEREHKTSKDSGKMRALRDGLRRALASPDGVVEMSQRSSIASLPPPASIPPGPVAKDARQAVKQEAKQEAWVLPFAVPRDRIPPVTRVRSTLVASSLQALRERNLLDAYASLLPREHHDLVLHSVAGSWLAIDVGLAHYRAMDALGLLPTEIHEIGRAVAVKVQGTFLATLAKLATSTGVTPWAPLEQLDRIWARVFIGGMVGVLRRGPKEAHCELLGNPLVDVPYFRIALRGLIGGGLHLFASKAYVTEVSKEPVSQRAVYRLAWA